MNQNFVLLVLSIKCLCLVLFLPFPLFFPSCACFWLFCCYFPNCAMNDAPGIRSSKSTFLPLFCDDGSKDNMSPLSEGLLLISINRKNWGRLNGRRRGEETCSFLLVYFFPSDHPTLAFYPGSSC